VQAHLQHKPVCVSQAAENLLNLAVQKIFRSQKIHPFPTKRAQRRAAAHGAAVAAQRPRAHFTNPKL